MAAVSTVMQALLKSGDHIVSVNDVYGGVNRFFRKVASGFNISVTLVDATNTSNVENAIKDNTKVREREEEIESEKKREKREGGRREREGEEREKESLQVYVCKVCYLIVYSHCYRNSLYLFLIILLFIQVIWMESPTNPTLTVIDIAAVSDIAHKKVIMEYIILYIILCVCVGMYCCG